MPGRKVAYTRISRDAGNKTVGKKVFARNPSQDDLPVILRWGENGKCRIDLLGNEAPHFSRPPVMLIGAAPETTNQDEDLNPVGMASDEKTLAADSSFLRIFTFDYVNGNHEALDGPDKIVLTEALAHKFFGSEDPIGKTIEFAEDLLLEVTAAIKDVPKVWIIRVFGGMNGSHSKIVLSDVFFIILVVVPLMLLLAYSGWPSLPTITC